MSVPIQDVVVTVVSIGALGWLVQRVVGLVTPARKSPGCHGCERCETFTRPGPQP